MDCFELKEFLERAHTEKLKRLEEYRKELKAKEINLYHKETELERALKARQWISVKDRLPEDMKPVLVFMPTKAGGLIETGILINKVWRWGHWEDLSDDEIPGHLEVTHWMPLPEPPEGEG